MSRKMIVVALLGLCVLLVMGRCGFGQCHVGGSFEGRPGVRASRGSGNETDCRPQLPEWKKRAIRKVRERARAAIQAVLEDDSLSREQKMAKIRKIRRAARKAIRRIIRSGRHKRRGGADTGD